MIPAKWQDTFAKDPQILITGEFKKQLTFKQKLKNSLIINNKIMILRIKEDREDLHEICEIAQKFCKKHKIPFILNTPNKDSFNADGIHLTSLELNKTAPVNKILGISCHSEEEIQQAIRLKPDYILLSPVVRKGSSAGFGWDKFYEITSKFPNSNIIPLGGINESNAMQESFAGISHWWHLQKSR